jgi:hypothetical protein
MRCEDVFEDGECLGIQRRPVAKRREHGDVGRHPGVATGRRQTQVAHE